LKIQLAYKPDDIMTNKTAICIHERDFKRKI